MNHLNHLINKKFSTAGASVKIIEFPKNTEDKRLYLRKELLNHLTTAYNLTIPTDLNSQISDLKKLPSHPLYNISLSHTSTHAAIACVKKPFFVGIDLESQQRVQPATVKRILAPQEALGPQPIDTWVLKEAAFKALNRPFKLKTLSQIHLSDWTPYKASTEAPITVEWQQCRSLKCNSCHISDFLGLSLPFKCFKLGIFVSSSQLWTSSSDQ